MKLFSIVKTIIDVIFQPLLDDVLKSCSVNRVPIFLIDPIVLKNIHEDRSSQDEKRDCSCLCQKSLITLGVLESTLNPNGLNARVCGLFFMFISCHI